MNSIIKLEIIEHLNVCEETISSISSQIENAAQICIDTINNNRKILIMGNGGSASDAQHIAAELVGRFKNERKGLPAIALNTDTSIITSVANDFGYSKIFERQVESLAVKGDVVIGISTGGTSLNVVKALSLAKLIGCHTIGFSGKSGGQFNTLCDVNLVVKSENTPRIQEMHIVIGHIICNLIDLEFSKKDYVE